MVQLSGFVRSQADIDQAVKVARGVAGVKSVKNDMRVSGSSDGTVLELLTNSHDGRVLAAQTASYARHHASGRGR